MFLNGFVNLYTRDIEAALAFYRDLLGFTEAFRAPTDGAPEQPQRAAARPGWQSGRNRFEGALSLTA